MKGMVILIKVCDSLMGTGKTSAAIEYMNNHPEKKFVYVTPYLDEVARIKDACKKLHFVEPSGKIPDCAFSKVRHTVELLKKGRNIATTHAAFTSYPIEYASIIKEKGYTLILDECLSMLEKSDATPSDIDIALKTDLLRLEDGVIVRGGMEYNGKIFHKLVRCTESKGLVMTEEDGMSTAYFWIISPSILLSFEDVILMTYMFSGQEMSMYMAANNIQYQYIGVCHDKSGYHFTDSPVSDADLCREAGGRIEVFDDPHWNSIGDDYYAMSMNWFATKPESVDALRKKLGGYFNYVNRNTPNSAGLWGTYTDGFQKIKGAGYTKIFLPFNARATNEYRDRVLLAYPCNVFMNVRIVSIYEKMGIKVDQERYALSVMLQWIWRSAIRDGKSVKLYLPSSRMRSLLNRWINGEFSVGGEIDAERSA